MLLCVLIVIVCSCVCVERFWLGQMHGETIASTSPSVDKPLQGYKLYISMSLSPSVLVSSNCEFYEMYDSV